MRVNQVHQGDCLDVMATLPDNCIDTILTDPPYDLTGKSGSGGFMGKSWDASGIAFNPDVWRECLRVAKPGATLMAFGGTRTYHRLTCAIEDAGWEIRDCVTYFHDGNQAEEALMASLSEEQLAAYLDLHYPNNMMAWTFGSGFPKSSSISKSIDRRAGAEREVVGGNPNGRNTIFSYKKDGRNSPKPLGLSPITAPATPLAQQWDGWGTALKPAYEPIVLAMKPMPGSYAENAETWGVAGLNIDGGRVEANGRPKLVLDAKETNNTTYAGRMNGSLSGGSKAVGTTDQGRYPANLIHDGSDEVLAEFDKAGVRVSNSGKGAYNIQATENRNNNRVAYGDFGATNGFVYGDKGSAARFFQQCPPDPTDHPDAGRFHYCPKAPQSERQTPRNNHPTQKPLSLMRYLCKLTKTPTGGVVLDPFGGSGTTGLAAIAEGRDYIIIEKEPEYCQIIRRRIAEYTGEEIAPKEIKVTEDQTAKQMSLW